MSNKLYNGSSESVSGIVEGYCDYAMNVIAERAFPDVRDGMKPVQRRVLYSLSTIDKGVYIKTAGVVSRAFEIHPHGLDSIYQSMCLMTDENESYNVPYIKGNGNFGKVYSSKGPAAMRYTKCYMDKCGWDLFKDGDVMELVESEEGEGLEPTVLNSIYPNVLMNSLSGIAVATGSQIPSFNFKDVLELTIKYIENGCKLALDDVIIPDFSSGGVLVANQRELVSIMLTGKGKLKVRARVEINGSEIYVKELPVGKTVEGIVKNIESANINGISKVINGIGRNSDALLIIRCKTRRIVEDVLMELYRKNILQSTYSSNIIVTNNKTPMILGVHGVIKEWHEWRRTVVAKKAKKMIEASAEETRMLSVFLKLFEREEIKEEYIRIATKVGRKEAIQYLLESIEGCTESDAKWICERSITVFHRGGTYLKRYNELCETNKFWTDALNDIDRYIVNELTQILKENKNNFPRKSEVTYKDYKFSKISNSEEIEDDSFCMYALSKDGFLKKTRNDESDENTLISISGRANDVLIGFDNYGRILRVVCKEIPYTRIGESGTYLPKYFGVGDEAGNFDYKILYLCPIDGKRRMLVYRDGYIGFFDTSEYVGKKNIKIIAQGVCLAVKDKLLHIYEEEDIPDYILLADDTKDKIRLGIVNTADVPVRSRTSRAKVLSGVDIDTHYLNGYNGFDLVKYITNSEDHIGKLKNFKGEFIGDPSDLDDGFYLNICKDFN